MKKNLMSVLILALLFVNIVLSAIMMFSVTGAMKSTTALVGKIATVLDMELDTGAGNNEIAIENVMVVDLSEAMTIPLRNSVNADGTVSGDQHYAMIAVSLQMDKTHKDYSKYSETLLTNESIIKGEIIEVVSAHTVEEFQNDTDSIRKEILARLHKMYNSDFIYKIVFSDVKVY